MDSLPPVMDTNDLEKNIHYRIANIIGDYDLEEDMLLLSLVHPKSKRVMYCIIEKSYFEPELEEVKSGLKEGAYTGTLLKDAEDHCEINIIKL